MTPSALSERMTGKISWRIDELWKAADCLSISLAELIISAERTAELTPHASHGHCTGCVGEPGAEDDHEPDECPPYALAQVPA